MSDIATLRAAIESRFQCEAAHLGTQPEGDTDGGVPYRVAVEIFSLDPPVPARFCFGWVEWNQSLVIVPQVPPVVSPRAAVLATLEARCVDRSIA